MFQRDYISKVIEEMNQIPARVLGLRADHKLELAEHVLDDYYLTYLKTDRAHCLIPEAAKLEAAFKMEFGQIEPFSMLLNEEAELLFARGNKQLAILRREKALELLEFVDEQDKVNYSPDRKERIRVLKSKLTFNNKF